MVHEAAETLDLDCHPTYFETVTAMGFWLFRELGVETAVVEVGLGGRLDATNVVEPALTVITPIDFDHEIYLGHTLEAIAGEKAGILKPGVPAVFARQRPEASAGARSAGRGIGRARVLTLKISRFAILQIDARGSRFSGYMCPLAGEHQIDNAVTAALALESLDVAPRRHSGRALARTSGVCRAQSRHHPRRRAQSRRSAGAGAISGTLFPGPRIWMIYGAMRDKAIEEVAGILFPWRTS